MGHLYCCNSRQGNDMKSKIGKALHPFDQYDIEDLVSYLNMQLGPQNHNTLSIYQLKSVIQDRTWQIHYQDGSQLLQAFEHLQTYEWFTEKG